MCSISDQLIREFDVIIQIVFISLLHCAISRVADRRFNNSSGLSSRFHSENQIRQIIQTVENAENVHSVVVRELAEFANGVVGIICVADSVRAAKKHLKRNIRDLSSKLLETLPRTFAEETKGNVEGGSSPAFERTEVLHLARDKWSTAWFSGQSIKLFDIFHIKSLFFV